MKMLLSCVVLLLIWAPSKADTLTLMTNQSVNGKVSYDGGEFFVEARFRGHLNPKLAISREYVKSIEMNQTVDNPGSPPEWLTAYEDHKYYAKYNPVNGTNAGKRSKTKPGWTLVDSGGATPTKRSSAASGTDVVQLSDGTKRTGGLTLLNQTELNLKTSLKTEKMPRTDVRSITIGH